MKRIGRLIGVLFLLLLITSCVLPYCISLSRSLESEIIPPFKESHFFEVDGITLHYRIMASSSNASKKILLVHGLGGSTYSFEHTMKALSDEDYMVVAVDLPGFGYSSRNPTIDHSQLSRARLLWSLLDYIDTEYHHDRGWHLVGHSMGGGTVAALAHQRAPRVESIVFIAGALEQTNRGGGLTRIPPIVRWTQVLLEHHFISYKQIEKFLTSAYGRPPTEQEVLGYLTPLQIPGTARSAAQISRTSKNIDLQELSLSSIPLFGIWGEHDTWVPLEQGVALQSYFPHKQLFVIEGGGHVVMETHPDKCNALLLDIYAQFN